MKTSLIIFGMIFLVIGVLFYYIPMQEVRADTSTTGTGGVDTRTSSARVTVPTVWASASAIIGLGLLLFGLIFSSPNTKTDSYDRVVESKENIEVGDGNKRKIVRERTEKHRTRKGEDLE